MDITWTEYGGGEGQDHLLETDIETVTRARAELLSHRGNYYLNEWKEGRREGRKTVGLPFLLVSFLRRPTYNSDILDVTHVSRIFRHCNNPELPF